MKRLLLIISPVLVGFVYFQFFLSRTASFTADVDSTSAIEVQQNAGQVYVTTSNGQNISGTVKYKGTKPTITTTQQLILNGVQSKIQEVNINLPEDAFPTLTLAVGAGNLELLLRNSALTTATISAGAGNLHLVLPRNASSDFTISVGAGNIQLDVPTGIQGLRFVIPQGSSFNVDNQNYTLVDGGYQTKGFDEAEIKSTIHLSAGSSNLSIKQVD